MKKVIALAMCVVVSLCAFSACSKSASKDSTTTSKNSSTTVKTTEIATSDAKISGSAAIELLKSYDKKTLELQDVSADYQFMLATVGAKINGERYIRAEAGAMVSKGKNDDGQQTYEMKSYKTYFISFDGTKILISEGKNKYKTIKIDNKKLASITTTAVATTSSKVQTTAKK